MSYGNEQERLLRVMADNLKLPLVKIARGAELSAISQERTDLLEDISQTANMAIRLIDSYLLSLHINAVPNLELEPVSLPLVAHEVLHGLSGLAQQYDCDLEIDLEAGCRPVITHRNSLESALSIVGQSIIESASNSEKRGKVVFGLHKNNKGLVAGIYGNGRPGSLDLKRGRVLFGSAQQPVGELLSHSGGRLFIADSLLSSMNTTLKVLRHRNMIGLGATLLPSHQLRLV